jgi:hypothetical protein
MWTVITGVGAAHADQGIMAHHDLMVSLLPHQAQLTGRDRIRIQGLGDGQNGHSVTLWLSPRAHIQSVRVDGREHPYRFEKGRLTLTPDRRDATAAVDVSVDYSGRFDDPAPVQPVNTDNPGYGVSGTISEAGTFLLAGAGWYPRMLDARETVDLQVEGPGHTVAVTTGKPIDITPKGAKTVSRWRIDHPMEGLSLSTGPYMVDRQSADGFTAVTYLFRENRGLSPVYLEASLRYLKRYSDLFGSYPFEAFSVVENFFPTGYGFAGYTLMGGMVLRLPFIPDTSLAHEIAHNWWGNGVLVDFASGNWCEGLTSYTADYLNAELISPEAGLEYRRQALRSFTALVSDETDVPLAHFRSRSDSVTKAVGYDKASMVFHMLRNEMGDAAFWEALRDLYHQFRFKQASWHDLQQVFEKRAGRSLDRFFRQWIDRPGAAQLALENVRLEATEHGFVTTGSLVQKKPYYDLTAGLVLETETGPVDRTLRITGRQTAFEIPTAGRPQVLMADPGHHLFRRLTPQEMPPTVNTVKGSARVVVVIAKSMQADGQTVARQFVQAMGVKPSRLVDEADLTAADTIGFDLLFVGLPEDRRLLANLPGDLSISADSFQLNGHRYDSSEDAIFLVTHPPGRPDRLVALLHAGSTDAAVRASRKIAHYGRYSYLAFSDGQNRDKGTWEVADSPLIVRLNGTYTP